MAPINKGRLIVTLFLFCELFCSLQAINSHGVEELYRALNVTCLEERDLTKEICQSEVSHIAIKLAEWHHFIPFRPRPVLLRC